MHFHFLAHMFAVRKKQHPNFYWKHLIGTMTNFMVEMTYVIVEKRQIKSMYFGLKFPLNHKVEISL